MKKRSIDLKIPFFRYPDILGKNIKIEPPEGQRGEHIKQE